MEASTCGGESPQHCQKWGESLLGMGKFSEIGRNSIQGLNLAIVDGSSEDLLLERCIYPI